MNLKKFTSDILERILKEVKKDENISKIHKQLIDPLISYAYKKINPYIITLFSIIILSFNPILFVIKVLIKTKNIVNFSKFFNK